MENTRLPQALGTQLQGRTRGTQELCPEDSGKVHVLLCCFFRVIMTLPQILQGPFCSLDSVDLGKYAEGLVLAPLVSSLSCTEVPGTGCLYQSLVPPVGVARWKYRPVPLLTGILCLQRYKALPLPLSPGPSQHHVSWLGRGSDKAVYEIQSTVVVLVSPGVEIWGMPAFCFFCFFFNCVDSPLYCDLFTLKHIKLVVMVHDQSSLGSRKSLFGLYSHGSVCG